MTITGGTWTYSGDPAASDLDAVRFLSGDTNERNQQISDEEILFALVDAPDRYAAAALVCRTIATYAATEAASLSVGDMSISGGQNPKDWEDRALSLERQSALRGNTPSPAVGGISKQRRSETAADTDLVQPAFTVGQFDYVADLGMST